jgi:hypothetical protein
LHDRGDRLHEIIHMDRLHALLTRAGQRYEREARHHREQACTGSIDAEDDRGLHDGPVER